MITTIGCDPEVFLKRGGEVVSAIGKVGGTKANPIPVKGGTLQEDNILAEIGIDPAKDRHTFVQRVQGVLGILKERTGCDLDIASSHTFTKEWLLKQGGNALAFGCDRDYNIYTGSANPRPPGRTLVRGAGGHVHIGVSSADIPSLIKTLDLYLAVPAVIMDPDTERRKVYGKAGCYRKKPYGVEYRTLSNFWLRDKELMEWLYDRTIRAVFDHREVRLPDETYIQACINNSDREMARRLIGEYRLEVPKTCLK